MLLRLMLLPSLLAMTACAAPAVERPADLVPDRVSWVGEPKIVQVVEGNVILPATKALVVAELAYNSAARLALTATNAGLVPAAAAGRLRALNDDAIMALRIGYKANTAAEKASAALTVMNLSASIQSLLSTPRSSP